MQEESAHQSMSAPARGFGARVRMILVDWGPWLLVLWPAAALFALVRQYGINAPFLDDYETVPLIDKAARGALTAHDFFAAQMEHRIAWLRLVALVCHKLWPGHCWIAQVWFNWVLRCLTLVNLALLLRWTAKVPLRRCWPLLALASPLLFSPAQFEAILWPITHQLPGLMFFLTTALVAWLSPWPVPARFFAALLCALCATFSLVSGFLVWVFVLPVMIWSAPMASGRARWLAVGAWLLALAATVGFYFHDLRNEAQAAYTLGQGADAPLGEKLAGFIQDPLRAFCYVARLLGNSLMRGNDSDLMTSSLRTGVTLLALEVFCLGWWLWRFRDAELRRRMVPWLAMGGYAIAVAVAITMGRVWLGVSGVYALSTRYGIHSVPLVVSVAVLIWMIAEDLKSRLPRLGAALSRLLLVAGVALAMLELASWNYGESMMEAWSSSRKRSASAALFFRTGCPIEGCYPDWAMPDCLLADDLHLLHPPMLRNLRLDNFSAWPSPLNETYATWSSLRIEKVGEALHGLAAGRAIHKNKSRVVDAVLLAYKADDGHWEIFHVTEVNALPLYLHRVVVRDLEFMHPPPGELYEGLSAFKADFKLDEIPPGRRTLAAWAYDYDSRRISWIPGAFELDTASGAVTPLGNGPDAVQLADFVRATQKRRGR